MKICITQSRSEKGDIQKNIANHLDLIETALQLKADLIIFPELSITNYEPPLAKEFASTIASTIFDPFQELSDLHGISIGIGIPTIAREGIQISLLIFQAQKERIVYAKQILHTDELPYFVSGNKQLILSSKDTKIAFGFCYESLQREHFVNAKKQGADVYIASVAKPKGGIEKAYQHFPQMAMEFNTAILLSNCVGPCDDFMSVGQSAVWNPKGELLKKLDARRQGLLVYDTQNQQVTLKQFKV